MGDRYGYRLCAGHGAYPHSLQNIVFALSLTPLKMFQISPSLTLYCVFPIIITFAIAHKGIAFIRQMMKEWMVELQDMSSKTVGFLNGVEVIRSHSIQAWAEKEFDRENIKIRDRSLRLAKVRTIVLPVIAYTDRLLKVMILAIGGGYLIKAQLTLGELTALLSYASLLAMPFISLGMVLSAWQNGIVSLESLRRILDLPLDEQDQTHLPVEQQAQLSSKGIRVSNLSYSYPSSDTPVLKTHCRCSRLFFKATCWTRCKTVSRAGKHAGRREVYSAIWWSKAPPVFEKPPGTLHDWEIFVGLGKVIAAKLGQETRPARPPHELIDYALSAGPYADNDEVTIDGMLKNPSGIDLGPLTPSCPQRIQTENKRINSAPSLLLGDLKRLKLWAAQEQFGLRLIGRRHVRSNNSWMHNSHRQLPHGWGHDRNDVKMGVAQAHAGVSANDVTDEKLLDQLSGNTAVNGVPVTLAAF